MTVESRITTSPLSDGVQPVTTVFLRELAEVYLLIDHISSNPDKRLPVAIDIDGDGKKNDRKWMEQICNLTWPPLGTLKETADQAAMLIRTRDALNRLAAPASGASIAFTLMTVGEDLVDEPGLDPQKAEAERAEAEKVDESGTGAGATAKVPWHRRLRAGLMARISRRVEVSRRMRQAPLKTTITGLTRYGLAYHAFPNLELPAARFAVFNRRLVFLLFAWLFLTCGLSWNVAAGNALASQLSTAQTALDNFDYPPTQAQTQRRLAAAAMSAEAATRRAQLVVDLAAAEYNLDTWARGWNVFSHSPWPGKAAPPRRAEAEDRWAQALLTVLGGSVLPICYGLLGAGAAVVRSLSSKMRDSVLVRRDELISWVQLALGAVIGGCIGLFVTPAGGDAKSDPSLLGPVHLSASALCFIAGFGVERVFLTLEAFITRVFSLGEPPKHPA